MVVAAVSVQLRGGEKKWMFEREQTPSEMAAQMHADDMRITEIIDIRAAWGDEV